MTSSIQLARQPKSKAEALVWSEWLISCGYSIDMGLTQVSSANMVKLRTSIHARSSFERPFVAALAALDTQPQTSPVILQRGVAAVRQRGGP